MTMLQITAMYMVAHDIKKYAYKTEGVCVWCQ